MEAPNSWKVFQLDRVFPQVPSPWNPYHKTWSKSSWVNQQDPVAHSVGPGGRTGARVVNKRLYLDPKYDMPDIYISGPLSDKFPNNPYQDTYEDLKEVQKWSESQRQKMYGETRNLPFAQMKRQGPSFYSWPARSRQPGLIDSLQETDPYAAPQQFRKLVPFPPALSPKFMNQQVAALPNRPDNLTTRPGSNVTMALAQPSGRVLPYRYDM